MTQHSHSHDKGKRADEWQAQEPQAPAERLPHHERQHQPDRNLSNEEAPQPGKCAVCMKPQAKKARRMVGKTCVRSGMRSAACHKSACFRVAPAEQHIAQRERENAACRRIIKRRSGPKKATGRVPSAHANGCWPYTARQLACCKQIPTNSACK